MNLALAPRHPRCRVCRDVHAVEDVNWRMWNERLKFLGYAETIEYLRSIGIGGSDDSLRRALTRHRQHVEEWAAAGAPNVYTPGAPQIQRLSPPERGPTRWLDVTQTGVDLGMESLRLLRARMEDMSDRDLIAVARLGLGAATTIGNMEARGRALHQVDAILRLAAGIGGDYDGSGEGSANQ
jgi:hypothetical protein